MSASNLITDFARPERRGVPSEMIGFESKGASNSVTVEWYGLGRVRRFFSDSLAFRFGAILSPRGQKKMVTRGSISRILYGKDVNFRCRFGSGGGSGTGSEYA